MKKGDSFSYEIGGERYPVEIVRKRFQRNTYVRFVDGKFVISTYLLARNDYLVKLLDEYAAKLLVKAKKKDPFSKDGVYLFGDFVKLEDSFLKIDGHFVIFSNRDEFYKKIKKLILPYFERKVEEYEKIMGVKKPYSVTLRRMKSRYGSNNKKTHRLTFNIELIHYSQEIMDSVIVHELAHDFYFDHKKHFYDVVYRYYPDYDIYHEKLRKGEFK
jgi:predicted metal-dependent hydrolase